MRLECPDCGGELKIPVLRKSQGYSGRIFLIVFMLATFAGGYFLFIKSGKRTKETIKTVEKDTERSPDEIIPAHARERENNSAHNLLFEAEDAKLIEASFEIDYDDECSGGKYLLHPEDSGSAWVTMIDDGKERPAGIGRADYEINIPTDGDWYFWGRVKWECGCSDAFFLFVDDLKPARRQDVFITQKFMDETFGKDETLDSWHWISSQVFNLKKGKHILSLRNQDDGSAIDKFLLTNDVKYRPRGLGGDAGKKDITTSQNAVSLPQAEEKIHDALNFYIPWFIDAEIIKGKWKTGKDKFFALNDEQNKEALIVIGENDWKDYQMVFLCDPPSEGRAGAVFYRQDDKNYYCLEIKAEKKGCELEIYKVIAEKKISLKNIPFLQKSKQNESRIFCDIRSVRLTINRFKDKIQVFVDGSKVIELSDASLSSGKAGFFSSDAKGFFLDDIEIASIGGLSPHGKNEQIEWFTGKKARVFNSVLDSFGATGGFHPGDYRNERKESALASLQARITGKECGITAEIIDSLWLTFDKEFFKEHYGMSKEEGFIIGQSLGGNKSILWLPSLLVGDWDFSFKLAGDVKEFGIELSSTFSTPKNPQNIFIPLDKKSVGDKWRKFTLQKRSGKISIFENGKIKEAKDLPEGFQKTISRGGISFKDGTLFIDSAWVYLYPDLRYDFKYNVPWELALSDWDLINIGKITHGGGYYCYAILAAADKKFPAKIASKRFFDGDFSALLTFELEDTKEEKFESFSLGFADKKNSEEWLTFTRDSLTKFSGVQKEVLSKLANFSTENRRQTQIFLSAKNGELTVHLNDEDGTMRPVDCGKFSSLLAPFSFTVSGNPDLKLCNILLWGKESVDAAVPR
jgi:hypothetical protein